MRIQHLAPSKLAKQAQFFQTPTLVVLTEADWKRGKWLALLPAPVRARVEAARDRLREPLEAGSRLCVQGQAKGEEDVLIALLPAAKDMYFQLEHARDSLKEVVQPSSKNLRIFFVSADRAEASADAHGAALAARTFLMPVFGKRAEKQKPFQLAHVELVSGQKKDLAAFEYGHATGEGTNLARYLATLPPNVLNPAHYADRIKKLCKELGLGHKFHSKTELKKMGAGAFIAVDQANPDSVGGIHEISYEPKGGKKNKRIHLVGKGLCFDTGGYDIKVGGGMLTMKGDMQGSAVALATLVTAAHLKSPFPMKAFLGITENHISPLGYKADEVITALNGLTIEVVNTDAEGRMVLADTLTLASRDQPTCVIDFATLTGSAVRSIGTRYSAGFTNRDKFHGPIRDAGTRSGERVWTFPIDSTYAKGLESKVADTVQCMKGPGPDHIMAACFLAKFVAEDTPWVHIDLAASENDGGLAHVDSLFTGFGVRWATEFIRKL